MSSDVSNLTISDMHRLELRSGSFSDFPRTAWAGLVRNGIVDMPNRSLEVQADTLLLEDNTIQVMVREINYLLLNFILQLNPIKDTMLYCTIVGITELFFLSLGSQLAVL